MKAEEKTMLETERGELEVIAWFDTNDAEGPKFQVLIEGESVDLSSFARLFARNLGANT